MPSHSRLVGRILAQLPAGTKLPWHRVVNSKGEISARKEGDSDHRQRQKLVAEGIVFNSHDRIDLDRFGWEGIDSFVSLEDWPENWPHPDQWQQDRS